MFEEFMTVKEARQTIRVGETKIYELLNEGKIVAIKIGRKTLIPKASLQSFMNSCPEYKVDGVQS